MHQEDIIFKVKLATSRGGNLTKNAPSRAVYYYDFFILFFCTSYCFFAHLIVFAHLIGFLHILIVFAHLIVLHI